MAGGWGSWWRILIRDEYEAPIDAIRRLLRRHRTRKLLLCTELEALLGEVDGEDGIQDGRRRGPIA